MRAKRVLLILILIFVLAFALNGCNFASPKPQIILKEPPIEVDLPPNGQDDKEIQQWRVKNVPYEQGTLRIDFINIGQGDCIFIIFPDGKSMLIDGGATLLANSSAIVRNLEYYGIKRLDYLMLTHPHADHVNSLPTVLKKYFVKEYFIPKLLPSYNLKKGSSLKGHFDTKSYNKFYEQMQAHENRGAIINYNIGVFSIVGLDYTFDFYCYGEEEYLNISGKSTNDEVNALSPIGFLTYNEIRYAFTGDTNYINEQYFISTYTSGIEDTSFNSFLLKVPHHGSNTSTTKDFLQLIRPQVSVICVGANIYGHPSRPVLERLLSFNSTIYNTRDNGKITVTQKDNEVTLIPSEGEDYFFSLTILLPKHMFSILLFILPIAYNNGEHTIETSC